MGYRAANIKQRKIYIQVTTYVYNMAETISVRIPEKDLKQIEQISKFEKTSKSEVLREVLEEGIKSKKLEIALEKYQKEEVSIGKAAEIAEIPLTKFLDLLKERKMEFHYSIEDLEEDFEGL